MIVNPGAIGSLMAVVFGACAVSAAAQTSVPEPSPASVGVQVGVSAGSGRAGVAPGGTFVWQASSRLSVEAAADYLTRGEGASATSVSGGILVQLLPAGRRAVPYAAVGAGLYRASFELGSPRLLGPVGPGLGPGQTVCPAPGMRPGPGAGPGSGMPHCPGEGPFWGTGDMPAFYARRLGPMTVPDRGQWGRRSFTDPMIVAGGGVRVELSSRVFLRPDARLLLVLAGGRQHTVGVFGLQAGYRF